MEQEVMVGAYSPYTTEIDARAQIAFDQAMDGFTGALYTPVAVSTQVVSGMNYNFFCNVKKTILGESLNEAAILSVYAPIEGKAHVTHLQAI